MRFLFLSLALLTLAVGPGPHAQVVPGGPFFGDGPRPFPIDLDSVAMDSLLLARAEVRFAESQAASEGGAYVVVPMRLGRASDRGPDVLLLVRDADRRVRLARYRVNGHESREAERAKHRIDQTHRFDADGRVVSVRLFSEAQPEAACGGGIWQSTWRVGTDADGSALTVDRFDRTFGRVTEATAPPEACVRAATQAPIEAFPTVEALLAGLRLPPLDRLRWALPEPAPPTPVALPPMAPPDD